jgi:hypothetical protein
LGLRIVGPGGCVSVVLSEHSVLDLCCTALTLADVVEVDERLCRGLWCSCWTGRPLLWPPW